MLKCDEFIGCYGSCDQSIPTGIIADFTGEIIIEFTFNNAKKKILSNAIQNEEIKIPNDFTPGVIHCVELKKADKTKIKNLSFKIYSQCL
ncbi:hypothetical protein [Chryseobacterium sp. 8AT]|uniref:hypothetical protein n=1 Tax=Chryseobacterium sp. 8AT TaxID=2653134 RepID=UPI0012F15884|nr:hypothetical protein [Chryseobacterium sp. 8AT]VXB02728.1 conserved hypothetical protein [Chryseobacterium sp. 8AT]